MVYQPSQQKSGATGTGRRKKVFRTMFIGLGGTGNQIIRRVKSEMLRHQYNLPIFQYLVLDTMQYTEEPNSDPAMHLQNGEEYLYIGGYNPNDILNNITQWPSIAPWWGARDKTNLVTVDEGAGQMRAVGRMGFFRHFKEIYEQLDRMVSQVMSGSNRDMLLRKYYEVPTDRAPVIYVVFSLCGGTGSSLFFDVAYILRKLFASMNIKPTIVAVALLPGPYIRQINSIPQKERLQANTYAALQELERLHNMALGQGNRHRNNALWDVEYTNSLRVLSHDLPFDYIYLVDDRSSSGSQYSFEQICDMLGQAIFWLSGPNTALSFWEAAKNLISNNLASGGRADASGRLRLSKYSSLGISAVAIDWADTRMQRALETLLLEGIKALKPVRLSLPRWLENVEMLIEDVGQQFAPRLASAKGVFKDRTDVQRQLMKIRTEYENLTNLQGNPRWALRKKNFVDKAGEEIKRATLDALRKRGPIATLHEVEYALVVLRDMRSALDTQANEANTNERLARQKYNDALQNISPPRPVAEVLVRIARFLQLFLRTRTSNKDEIYWKSVIETMQEQLHMCYTYKFRELACRELGQQIIDPAITFLQQLSEDLEASGDVVLRWLDANEEEKQRDLLVRAARAQASFEPIIWITPLQSEQDQIKQAMRRARIDVNALLAAILEETFRDWFSPGKNVRFDLEESMKEFAINTFPQRAGQESLLDRLLEDQADTQREQFKLRTDCLWSFQGDVTQFASSDQETVTLLGVGEKLDDPIVKNQLDRLLGKLSDKVRQVPTEFPDELVYLKTMHGLSATLLHGMTELHKSYQQMSLIKGAPYLHLDNREEVLLGYAPLANIDMKYSDVIDMLESAIRDLQRADKSLAQSVKTTFDQYTQWLISMGNLDQEVRIMDHRNNPHSASKLDPHCQLVDYIQDVVQSFSNVPDSLRITLDDLKGLLKTRGWIKTASNTWDYII